MKIWFSTFILLFAFACKQEPAKKLPYEPMELSNAQIIFNEKEFDFGTIQRNSDGSHGFVFYNKGTEPLVLSKVHSSCGCTVPEWPRNPIAPGDSGVVTIKYNTNLIGPFSKSIVVDSNAENENGVLLKIKGKVLDNEPGAHAAAATE